MKACRLDERRNVALVSVYYIAAALNALFEGLGMLLLVELISRTNAAGGSSDAIRWLVGLLGALSLGGGTDALYAAVIALFFCKALFMFLTSYLEGYLQAIIRRRIQDEGFSCLVRGEWEALRDIRVGQRVGAVAEEASNIARLLISIIKALYGCVSAAVFVLTALTVSVKVTVLFGLIGVPVMLILRHLFGLQAKVVEMLVQERQNFYANVTERLHNLFQIKVERNLERQIGFGLRNQETLTRHEIRWSFLQSIINGFNAALPAVILLLFALWVGLNGQRLADAMALLASIGIIGTRALNSVNLITSHLGNVTGFSGSIPPVHALFLTKPEAAKADVPGTVTKAQLTDASYFYSDSSGISGITLTAGVGEPLILMGPSGAGKTTIANLLAGLYEPHSGAVSYVNEAGDAFDGVRFRPRVGYVTQDIQLFQGSVRENASTFREGVSDDEIWTCLERAGAAEFVRSMGGLDAEIVEAGRSLSGGEKRRIGVARVLMQQPDILILDEVTAGLDEESRSGMVRMIGEISRVLAVVVITHDAIDLERGRIFDVSGAGRSSSSGAGASVGGGGVAEGATKV